MKQKRSLKEAVMCPRKRTDEVAAAIAAAPPIAAQEHSLSVSQLVCFELASSRL